jgi:hypothetical protein
VCVCVCVCVFKCEGIKYVRVCVCVCGCVNVWLAYVPAKKFDS